MPWTEIVNKKQREAIESEAANCAVIAGPGTGKTRTLLTKALQLIEDEIVRAGDIRIVNFTNAGVRDLKRKLLLDERFAPIVPSTITTFHSLALGALTRVNSTDVPSPLAILDDWEEAMFLDQFAKARLGLNDIRKASKIRKDYNSRWCIARLDVDDWLSEKSRRDFEAVYNAAKGVLGFTTRGELTFLWWRHMRSIPENDATALGFNGARLLVDEYQDLNECEHDILQRLAMAEVNVFAVGDPNQSIYEALRHAHPQLCWEFPGRMNAADLKVLEKSHRCPKAILIYGQALMGNASGIPDPEQARDDGEAHILSFPSDSAERSGITRLVSHILETDSSARVMLAVPAKTFAASLANDLQDAGLEVENRTKRQEEESSKCRLARALLRLLKQPNENVAAATAIVLRCAVTTRSQAATEILMLAYERSERVAAFLQSDAAFEGRLGKAIERVRSDLTALRDAGSAIGARLQELTGCTEVAPDPEQAQQELEELLDDPAALDEGKVTIMTLHSAKGLEADWVVLPAVEPGSYERDEVGARREERRRLLFVGMTRARRGLFLTYAQNRYGPTRYADPTGPSSRKGASVFIQEMCDRLGMEPESGSRYIRDLLQ